MMWSHSCWNRAGQGVGKRKRALQWTPSPARPRGASPDTLDFKQHHFYIQIWKSRFSNLKIPIFKFEYPEDEIDHWDIGIFKFEYPDFQIWISRSRDWSLRHWDIQIWISRYSNLNISIFILMSYHPITIKKGVTSGKKIRYYLGTFPKCWTPPLFFFPRNHWDELIELIRYYLPLYGKHVLASQNEFCLPKITW